MKKRLICTVAAVVLCFTGCGKMSYNSQTEISKTSENSREAAELEKGADGQVTFSDSLGRSVSVKNPQRVVTLLGSFCDEWLLAGGSVVGTANDSFTSFELGLGEEVVNIGSHIEPDVEKIVGLEPDFVIASSALDSQAQLLETLEKAGITVAFFEVNSFNDYLDTLKIFTEITGHEELYEEYGTKVQKEIAAAKSQIDGRKPTVLFVRASASSVKVKKSTGTVGGEILADLDTVNIADSGSVLEDLSMEAIVAADPDYIFVTTQGSDTDAAMANVKKLMTDNPAWSSLRAVSDGNYYVIDKALYNSKPNARWGEAYQRLADIIYPRS